MSVPIHWSLGGWYLLWLILLLSLGWYPAGEQSVPEGIIGPVLRLWQRFFFNLVVFIKSGFSRRALDLLNTSILFVFMPCCYFCVFSYTQNYVWCDTRHTKWVFMFFSTTDMSQKRVVSIHDIKGLKVISYLTVDKADRV